MQNNILLNLHSETTDQHRAYQYRHDGFVEAHVGIKTAWDDSVGRDIDVKYLLKIQQAQVVLSEEADMYIEQLEVCSLVINILEKLQVELNVTDQDFKSQQLEFENHNREFDTYVGEFESHQQNIKGLLSRSANVLEKIQFEFL